MPPQYVIVGIVGILLYATVFGVAAYIFYEGLSLNANYLLQIFLTMLMVMSIFEMPRYICLSIYDEYDSQSAYTCHIIAGGFFFIAFSIVCHKWCHLLKAGENYILALVYGTWGLTIANILFAVDDIVAIVSCESADSLMDFFNSSDFLAYTLLEGMRNIMYSSFLSYYGIMLVNRLWQLNDLRQQTNIVQRGSFAPTSSAPFYQFFRGLTEDNSDNIFALKVIRVTAVLLLCCMCFVVRLAMLVVKLATLDYNSAPTFSLFGLLWFTLADFIPRVVPCLALMGMVRSGRNAVSVPSSDDAKDSEDIEMAKEDNKPSPDDEDTQSNREEEEDGRGSGSRMMAQNSLYMSQGDGLTVADNDAAYPLSEEEEDLSAMFRKYNRPFSSSKKTATTTPTRKAKAKEARDSLDRNNKEVELSALPAVYSNERDSIHLAESTVNVLHLRRDDSA
jgi:hypothetical protein